MSFKNILYTALVLLSIWTCAGREYEFIPGRCVDHPGAEEKIGGPLSLCSFPPNYEKPDEEDIEAVIKHIQGLNLN
ncbi:uncharacterized protein LOC108608214 [Drosophila busckii]|uniref:uncharacterized protein LOC108608214 n=1 Tax=Drosophila busckii TaxID=30019 RepID=UPI001432A155|nr:uncharacterized protein LOC108608214 [Drosophila busckii]